MAPVEALGVAAVEILDPRAELRLPCEEDQVHVVSHQAEGVHLPLVAANGFREEREVRAAVGVVAEEERAVDTA
jgi:hypothetical protein